MGAFCEDCGKPYGDFGIDTTVPNSQWDRIHPTGEGGLLCANCMVLRASHLPHIIAARMVFEFAGEGRASAGVGNARKG